MREWHKTQCYNCGLSCGLEVEVEDNKILNVRPDPDSPRTNAYCCRKGRAAKYFQDHGERLNYPLKKVNGEFVRISWEQAFKEIGERANGIIEKYGPKSFSICGCALANDQSETALAKPLLKATGSQYFYNPIGIEFAGNWWAHGKIIGDQSFFTEPDEELTEVVIFWGSNAYVAHQVKDARTAIRERSGDPDKTVIVVDPRMSETARMADMHVAPYPGTDALLMRAMIAIILEKGWQDQKYIDEKVSDWDKAKVWFENFDVDGALRVCRVPRDQIERFCHILTHKKWGVHQDLGLFCGRHNTLNSYLLVTLMAVCGMLLVPGGNVIQESFTSRGESTHEENPDVWRTQETGRFPVLGVYPAGCLAAEMNSERPDRMRALICSLSNPVRSYPDSQAIARGLDRLELLVVIDITMTETAQHADYVLPGKTGFEAYQFNVFQAGYPESVCMLKHPFIGQIGERMADGEIWLGIAKSMGILPELPQSLYQAAEKAVKTGDRIPYFLKLIVFMMRNKHLFKIIQLVIAETMGKAMGSAARSLCWAALLTSYTAGTGMVEAAGWKPTRHKLLQKVPKMRAMLTMDAVFDAVDNTEQGVVFAVADRETAFEFHVKHEDKKLHLYCDEVNTHIQNITPEAEAAAIAPTGEFPLVLSAGRHSDDGDNATMRNPETYRYRQPYTVAINPEDAQRLGVSDGEMVRLTTKAGSIDIPAEYTWQTCEGYVLVPHHFGFSFGGKTYGQGINHLTSWEDMDEITGNPFYRFVPCRIDRIKEGEAYDEIIQ